MIRKTAFIVALLLLATLVNAESINVAAAISMKETLVDAGAAFQKTSDGKDDVVFTFGASGTLLTQIKNGAPVDAFISAAPEQIDQAERTNLAAPGSRVTTAMNDLVLIVPASSTLNLTDFADLKDEKVAKISIGQPKVVPAGAYATQVLKYLKLDDAVTPKLVFGANVRQVLDYVEHGEVEAGIVYSTDAQQAGGRVKIIATAPADSHEPIVYPAIILSASTKQATAKRFLNFLASEKGKTILQNHGFSVDAPAATQPAEQGKGH